MSEHKEPIPSRVYNAAIGGHVTGADQIIDDETGLTLDKVAGGALEEKEHISGSNNGMGRVVLRKNIIEGVNTLTQNMINKNNTIYIIQYDFNLNRQEIIVPNNCILKFEGGSLTNGSIKGNNTILYKYINNIYVTLFGEFIDGVTNTHVSNEYKVPQKNNIRLSNPLYYFRDGMLFDKCMKFQRKLGFDYYHIVYNLDIDNAENPTKIIWSSKSSYDTFTTPEEAAILFNSSIDACKHGILDGIKIHTEHPNIDTLLDNPSKYKTQVLTFLSLYKENITRFINLIGDRKNLIKVWFLFNEQNSFLYFAKEDEDVRNSIIDCINTIRNLINNVKISYSANNICKAQNIGIELYNSFDYISLNGYLNRVSYKGINTFDIDPIAVKININAYNNTIDTNVPFCISESGCINRAIGLVKGSYYKQDTQKFPEEFQAWYYYAICLLQVIKHFTSINRVQLWYLDDNYYDDNGILRTYYADIVKESSFTEKLFNLISNEFYEK